MDHLMINSNSDARETLRPSLAAAHTSQVPNIPALPFPPPATARVRGSLAAGSHQRRLHTPSPATGLQNQSPATGPQNQSLLRASDAQSFESLPHLVPTATKAGSYGKLMAFDGQVLKRPAAHCRHALRSTENIQAILTQLDKDLQKLQGRDELEEELAKLAVYRKALEELIPLTGTYASSLSTAKDVYDGRVEDTLRSEGVADLLERVQWNSSHRTREGATEKRSEAEEEKDEEEEGEGGRKEREKLENITEFSEQGKYFHPESATPDVVSINEGLFTSPLHGDPESGVSAETVAKRSELYQLRRELHQLEEKCRALLEEKTRLTEEMEEEVLKAETESPLPPTPEPEMDLSEVERLQMEIVEHMNKIDAAWAQRRERFPVQEYRHLEHGLMEVENEQGKLLKRNELLRQEVELAKNELQTLLDYHHTSQEDAEEFWFTLTQTY